MSTRHRTHSSATGGHHPHRGYTESPSSSATLPPDQLATGALSSPPPPPHPLFLHTQTSVHSGHSQRQRAPPAAAALSRARRFRHCCRHTIAFMCTQVGVGGLIVVYALLGAASFMSIETQANHTRQHEQRNAAVVRLRGQCAHRLWLTAERHNVLANRTWRAEVDAVLGAYQADVTHAIRGGWDGRTVQQMWTFPAALMFCLSVFSMIGYGNLVPRTAWGKGMTVVYATFGIPLYILYFLNIGKVLAKTLRWAYAKVYACSADAEEADDWWRRGGGGGADVADTWMSVGKLEATSGGDGAEDQQQQRRRRRVIVPSTACLWVMCVYIVLGTLMFAHWENWNYTDAVYFCVTSLCKIGMGDFVPGTTSNLTISVLGYKIQDSSNQNQTKLVINFVYMLVGMALVAMCYNLMREDVRMKYKEMSEDMALCMEDVRVRFSRCFGGAGGAGGGRQQTVVAV